MSIARPAWLKLGIALVLWASCLMLASAAEIRTLRSIEVVPLDNIEELQLEFDTDFLGEPLVNFEAGSMSLRLNSANTAPSLPLLTISKDSSITKAVRVVQVPNTNIVHLDILFKSSRMQLKHPVITHSNNFLLISLISNSTASPALSNSELLTEEIENRVKTDPSFTSTFAQESTEVAPLNKISDLLPMPAQNWGETMLTLVLSLLFVLLLIYLIAFLYNRFLSGRFPAMQGNVRIRQVSSYHVGPKQKIVVFEMNGRIFACGVTSSSINLIAELHDESDQEFLNSIETNENTNEIDLDRTRANFIKTLDPAKNKAKANMEETVGHNENLATSIELEGSEVELFIKTGSEKTQSQVNSKKNKNELSTSVRPLISNKLANRAQMTHGSQMMLDFASKLSERLKFLKPIK
ncbi:MAG: flagellar biosynthetic protein FliO [SAR324 cluster bacterium]|nr:flagellar biosynthetic protein FliO [SAR324 cluster bacterium]MBL7034676.1 flagellar biosynthetic protein FliO [SAR324 cluster bacterium]